MLAGLVHPGDRAKSLASSVIRPARAGTIAKDEWPVSLQFNILDYAALGWFLLCWASYTWLADYSRLRNSSISAAMARHRHRWMREMLARDLRMVDTQILGNLITGIGFFSSTSILMIGGLFAFLGAAEQAVGALSLIPFVAQTGALEWEIKVLLLIAIFVYAFFKFAWSFRLANFCSILVGAAPHRPASEAEAEAVARRAAELSIQVSHQFNRGLRAFFFALAAFTWFLHPVALAVSTVGVVLLMRHREFGSPALAIIRERPGADGDTDTLS